MSTLYHYRRLSSDNVSGQNSLFIVSPDSSLSWYQRESTAMMYGTVKRVFDAVAASILLLLFSPLFAIVACAIKMESKGPVFYCQQRVGKNGHLFCFWKFRSMRCDADELQAELSSQSDSDDLRFKMAQDPRITRIGKFIRKFSIDELPQLWNVVCGDMSLVGPRPALPNEVESYQPHQLRRLAVTPGITCTWQIGGRSDIPFEQQVDMDLRYIRDRSLIEDLRILFLTPYAVLSCRGAY